MARDIAAELAACDPMLKRYMEPFVHALTNSKFEPDDSFLETEIEPTRLCLKVTRRDGIQYRITIEKRVN
jgi:hypothetical protein